MPSLKIITRFFIFFTVSFVLLTILFSNQTLRQYHSIYYCSIADPIFNVLNPHIFTEFLPEAPENDKNWTMTFKVWDKRDYNRSLFSKSFRDKQAPKAVLFQNPHELILVPTLFLIALFASSPVKWRTALFRFLLAMVIFYIFMSLYFSYRFEFTLNGQNLPIDSIWHVLIWFCGLGGNTDPIYIVAGFIWAILIIPKVLKPYLKV